MIEIIPAIDIIDGKCVRLTKGDFNQKKIYSNNPVEVAKQFEDAGIQRLHLVDLDGAKTGTIKNLSILEKIAYQTRLKIDFGGGVKTEKDVTSILNVGATFVTIGSLAVKNPTLLAAWVKQFGAYKFIIGADTLNGLIQINGWQKSTAINIFDFIAELLALGITQVFCTDITKDGMQEGPSFELYKQIKTKNPSMNLIASGGVTTVNDIEELVNVGCSGVIIGKAIYEGTIQLTQLKQYL
jgi:phosphoribosylformimino-5-aminoimidazole carboxamide ribotide isomerase